MKYEGVEKVPKQISEELKKMGLNNSQIDSLAARTAVEFFLNNSGQAILFGELRDSVIAAMKKYDDLIAQMEEMGKVIKTISDATEEYGTPVDEKVRDAISMYATMIRINAAIGVDPNESAKGASYAMWAYWTGQNKLPMEEKKND